MIALSFLAVGEGDSRHRYPVGVHLVGERDPVVGVGEYLAERGDESPVRVLVQHVH
jgi:hypothetical protein